MKIFILLTTLCLSLRAEKSLYPLTDLFAVSGALYTKMNGEYLEFRRFPEEFAKIKASHLGFNLKKASLIFLNFIFPPSSSAQEMKPVPMSTPTARWLTDGSLLLSVI